MADRDRAAPGVTGPPADRFVEAEPMTTTTAGGASPAALEVLRTKGVTAWRRWVREHPAATT